MAYLKRVIVRLARKITRRYLDLKASSGLPVLDELYQPVIFELIDGQQLFQLRHDFPWQFQKIELNFD
jgi:hypothetical protein